MSKTIEITDTLVTVSMFEAEMEVGQWVMGHGSWVKWVTIFRWVTWVMGHSH